MAEKPSTTTAPKPGQTPPATAPETDSVPSLLTVLESEEIVGAESSFVLTDDLRSAVERGYKTCQDNPGGWLRVAIPEKVFKADGSDWEPTDAEASTILSERENDLRNAALQMGFTFRRQQPKVKDEKDPKAATLRARTMLYRIGKKDDKKS